MKKLMVCLKTESTLSFAIKSFVFLISFVKILDKKLIYFYLLLFVLCFYTIPS